MKIVLIDDEKDFLEIMKDFLEIIGETEVQVFTHWNEYEPKAGDTVIHDNNGVGDKKTVEGVRYILCSGSIERECDLEKPFSIEKLKEVLHGNG